MQFLYLRTFSIALVLLGSSFAATSVRDTLSDADLDVLTGGDPTKECRATNITCPSLNHDPVLQGLFCAGGAGVGCNSCANDQDFEGVCVVDYPVGCIEGNAQVPDKTCGDPKTGMCKQFGPYMICEQDQPSGVALHKCTKNLPQCQNTTGGGGGDGDGS